MADTAVHEAHDAGHGEQQACNVAVSRIRVPALRRAHLHVHAVSRSRGKRPAPEPDLRHPIHFGEQFRVAHVVAHDGVGGQCGSAS